MTSGTRQQVYTFVNQLGKKMAQYGPSRPWGDMIEAGSDDDEHLHNLLNRVEDDRAHREAKRLRQRAELARTPDDKEFVLEQAELVDPYEKGPDGELRRKSDGRSVFWMEE